MKEEQTQFEVEFISKAISLTFKDFNFIIDAFQRASWDTVAEVRQQLGSMTLKSLSQFSEVREIDGTGLSDPGIKENGPGLFVGLIPESSQTLVEEISRI